MKRITFNFIKIIILSSIFLNFGNTKAEYNFQKNIDYINQRKILLNYFKDLENQKINKEDFIAECINFGEKFFGEKNKEKGCILQLLRIKNQNTEDFDFTENEIYNFLRTKNLEIQFGGDIMLSRTVGYLNKKQGYDRIFKNFHPNKNISPETLLFYNLESPFSLNDNDILERTYSFRANTKNISVLENLKKENKMIISLANNHITNAGEEGIKTSIELLKNKGIFYIGIGKEKQNSKILKILQDNVLVCFSAYTYDGKIYKNYKISPIEMHQIKKDLEEMKKENCDFKIISLHWGNEYKFYPTKDQKNKAHEIIDAGADLILGHHSHILGDVEIYKNKMIYYSLGNFIFDQDWGEKQVFSGMDSIYDEKLKKYTIPTYLGNSFYHKYEIIDGKIKLVDIKNTIHRIKNGELFAF